MKPEYGKRYRKRDGKETGPLSDSGFTNYPFRDPLTGHVYTKFGHYWPNEDGNCDIVEEIPADPPVSNADAFVAAFSPDKDDGVLREAMEIVNGPRRKDYGHPHDDHSRIAKMWGAILGVEVPVDKVALCMIAVKVSRACNAPKRDSWVDMAGYAHIGHAVQKKMGLL